MQPKITFTGADGSIDPKLLIQFSQQNPFIEWGLLFSKTKAGTPRFPSEYWVRILRSVIHKQPHKVRLSAHLCGQLVHEILTGYSKPEDYLGEFWHLFDRVQLNTIGIPEEYTERCLKVFNANPTKEFIIQYRNKPSRLIPYLETKVHNTVVLVDQSLDRDIPPANWSIPTTRATCGFSGEFSPVNLPDQLTRLDTLMGSKAYWIDLEAHIRINGGKQVSIPAIESCIQLVKNHQSLQPQPHD